MPITRPTITDDTGDGLSGTIFNAAFWTDLLDKIDVFVETANSWTPAIGSSGGGAATYTAQVGRYLKIGRLVIAWGRVTLATKGTLAAGFARITGLPVAADNVSNLFGFVGIPFFGSMTTNVVSLSAYVQTNDTICPLQMLTAAAAGVSAVQVSDIGATFDLICVAIYRTQ